MSEYIMDELDRGVCTNKERKRSMTQEAGERQVIQHTHAQTRSPEVTILMHKKRSKWLHAWRAPSKSVSVSEKQTDRKTDRID